MANNEQNESKKYPLWERILSILVLPFLLVLKLLTVILLTLRIL